MAAGEIDDQPTEPLAHLLFGAMLQAGSVMASDPDPARAKQELVAAFGRLLVSLKAR